jgi:predicted component of type VI protein secretion system
MFLRPQHLQAEARYRDEALQTEVRRLQPFFWGLGAFEVAPDQLENHVFALRRLEMKMRDGTALALGANLRLQPRSFKVELDQAGGRLEVFVGVPVFRDSGANAFLPGEEMRGQDRRFVAEGREMLGREQRDLASARRRAPLQRARLLRRRAA